MDAQPPAERHGGPRFWVALLVVVLIIAGVGLTLYYGGRFLSSIEQLRHVGLRPGQTDTSLIREWMTVPYIARAYRVPENDLWQGLGIPEQGNRHKNLRALDREYASGKQGVVIDKVRAIIQDYQSSHSPTPSPAIP